MRRSREQKAGTHAEIVAVAARRFRERGLNGIGIADIMKEAGTTAGGFYKHFATRDDLVVEALAESFRFLDSVAGAATDLPAYLAQVLSDEHVQGVATGCALTALAGDMRLASAPVRTVYTERVKQTLAWYADHLEGGTPESRFARAVLLFSAYLGGVAVARAVNDADLSQQVLAALRQESDALAREPMGPAVADSAKPAAGRRRKRVVP